MDVAVSPGDLVFLTEFYNKYMHEKHPSTQICFTNRLAKLEMIIDWGSEIGKRIKAARIKSGKWEGLPLEDNKYIFSIYYHELPGKDGRIGIIERGVPLFSRRPDTDDQPFFEKIPDWVYKEILKKCEKFEVENVS